MLLPFHSLWEHNFLKVNKVLLITILISTTGRKLVMVQIQEGYYYHIPFTWPVVVYRESLLFFRYILGSVQSIVSQ
jgi:hypothetical protein